MSRQWSRVRRTSDDAILCHRLELGESFGRRFLGLMGRTGLDPGAGLWLPTSSIHMLFMRFPIDALFVGPETVDGGGRKVVGMRHDLPPWRGIILPVRGAAGVIEMPAGTLAQHGVRSDDVVVFEPLVQAPADGGPSAR